MPSPAVALRGNLKSDEENREYFFYLEVVDVLASLPNSVNPYNKPVYEPSAISYKPWRLLSRGVSSPGPGRSDRAQLT